MNEPESVDAYLEAQPERVRDVLRQVRTAVRKAVPQATEAISYGMPTYRLGKTRLLYFAAWTKHFSIYGTTAALRAALGDELAPYKVDKGTIQFPLSEPVPVKLIERIAQLRAQHLAERGR